MSTLFQLWRFANCLAAGSLHDGYDRLYVPRVAWTTGDIDAHDVGVDGGYEYRKNNRPFSTKSSVVCVGPDGPQMVPELCLCAYWRKRITVMLSQRLRGLE